MKRDPALEAYFAEAATWDADRATKAQRSERTAWWVAGAGWVGVVLLALALMLLIAAVGGVLLTLIIGSIRILQLRRTLRKRNQPPA